MGPGFNISVKNNAKSWVQIVISSIFQKLTFVCITMEAQIQLETTVFNSKHGYLMSFGSWGPGGMQKSGPGAKSAAIS